MTVPRKKEISFHFQRMFQVPASSLTLLCFCACQWLKGIRYAVDKILCIVIVQLIKDYILSKSGISVKLIPELPISLLGGCRFSIRKKHLCAFMPLKETSTLGYFRGIVCVIDVRDFAFYIGCVTVKAMPLII